VIKDRKIKFVVVGYGHIGKRHAETIRQNADCELVAVVDILLREKLTYIENEVLSFRTVEAFIAAEVDADVVSIATPNGFHARQAIVCLENGYHVIVEKPLAISAEDARLVIEKGLVSGKRIFPVMQNRYSPPSVWLKNIIEKNVLGEIFVVQMNCFWNRDERYYTKGGWHGTKELDGGTLFTQFSHFIDMLYWLLGDIKNIRSKIFNFNHQHQIDFEDSGVITFDLKRGGTGCFTYSTAVCSENFESSLSIIGQHGTVKVGGQYMNKVEYCQIQNYLKPSVEEVTVQNDYGSYKGSASNHHRVFENVVAALKEGASVDVKPEEALKVIEIIERIYETNAIELIN
jgi:UDP-N-acetyl-2-amino-2-deoxyglucuronate dehydrogenase